jgi:hypothetical protein
MILETHDNLERDGHRELMTSAGCLLARDVADP